MAGFKKALKWIGISLGSTVALCIVAVMGLGFAIELDLVPSPEVQTGEEMPDKHYQALRDARVLEQNETVKFYYSEGFLDITYGGSILTDKRVIGYWTDDDKVDVIAFPVDSLSGIEMLDEGGDWVDAEYEITRRGETHDALYLFLSTLEGAHVDMVNALEAQIEKNNAAHADSADVSKAPEKTESEK